jgi:polysaccharide biosynthesis protein PslG
VRGARASIALCALLAVALPTGAAAETPRSFYGVVTQSRLTGDDFARMDDGRVGTLRVTLAWSEVDPTPVPEDYDWSRFDQLVAEASRRGIVLLPTVYTVPRWLSELEGCDQPEGSPCSITPPRSQLGIAAWRSFLGTAARRYGPGGVFWALHPSLSPQPIRTWQIWNEMNSPGFFQPRPDVEVYADILRAASEAIRGVDPGAELILGGLFRNPLGGHAGGIRATDFLRQLYSYPGIEAAFEGVSIHPYAGRVSGVKRQVRRMIRAVRAAGDADAAFWITEVGWSSGGKRTPLNRGPDGQAQRLAQAFDWFTRKREGLNLRAVLWYAWRDVPESESRCKWCARSGLFPVSSLAQPKPAWASFLGFTGGG